MTFNNHILTAPLNEYIETIFHFKDFMPDHSMERVVPTGHVFLIFELDGFIRNTFDNESLKPIQSFTKVWISGMHRNYISISAHEKSEMLVVQFKAHGLYPFIKGIVEETSENVHPAENVFGTKILTLQKRILQLKNSEQKFKEVEKWLLQEFKSDKIPPEELVTILLQLQKEPSITFSKIINDYQFSQKHLIDQFKKYVGMTPKYYHRILRFNEILQKIQQKEKIKWSQVAYSCGYADQSHFIREFKHFSGFNPQEFIEETLNQDPPNFFPLD